MKTGRPAKTVRTEFGAKVHALREAVGLSQQQVAEQLGISQPAYALWERRNVAIRIDQIRKLADVLNVTAEELLETEQTNKRKGGPKGKAHKAFESVSRLPRRQQQKIIEVVEALLAQQKHSHGI